MQRPYWSGQIQISLVSFMVKLFVATEAKGEIRFHQIDRKTGERVRHQKVLASSLENSPDDASAVVEKSSIVKGYEYRKGEYITIEPEEIAQLRVPSKHTVEVSQFVDLSDLAPEYLEKPYFVIPENDMQTEAFAVVRAALGKTGKAALGKIAFGGREHVLAITAPADGLGMMAYTMRYQEELRDPAEYFRDIKKVAINEDSLELAETLIKKKAAKFDPSKFVDGYEVALKELVEAKVNKAPIPKDEPAEPKRNNVVNLMDALRKSLDTKAEQASAEVPKKAPKSASGKKGIALVKPAAEAKSAPRAAKRKTA